MIEGIAHTGREERGEEEWRRGDGVAHTGSRREEKRRGGEMRIRREEKSLLVQGLGERKKERRTEERRGFVCTGSRREKKSEE